MEPTKKLRSLNGKQILVLVIGAMIFGVGMSLSRHIASDVLRSVAIAIDAIFILGVTRLSAALRTKQD